MDLRTTDRKPVHLLSIYTGRRCFHTLQCQPALCVLRARTTNNSNPSPEEALLELSGLLFLTIFHHDEIVVSSNNRKIK